MRDPRKLLETATNCAILLVCGLLCWILIPHKSSSVGAAPGGAEEASLEGISLPSLPAYDWSAHPKTLVLAIRRGCHFCEDSLPFYEKLKDLEKGNVLGAHVLAVLPDDPSIGGKFLQSRGVAVESVFGQPLSSIHVSETPTLMLVDASGRVEAAWVGELAKKGENEVITRANANPPKEPGGQTAER